MTLDRFRAPRSLWLSVVLLSVVAPCLAQTDEQAPPPEDYKPWVPDLPQRFYDRTSVDERWFTLRLGIVPILDYTWFSQDDESLEQVGTQDDDFDVRSARVQVRGNLRNNREHPWKYLVSFEYRGLDTDPDNNWSFTDVSLTIPVGPAGDLTVGKIKEPFVYEMVGDAANLPQLERLLSPFFTSRSVGLRLNKVVLDERATLALGAYNDWFSKDLSYDDSGWDVSARATALPYSNESGSRYLHLGGGWRYVGADNGLLRYRGRAESNVSDYFVDATLDVDTGGIPASHANHWGAEAYWTYGPFSVLAEYVLADVSSTEAGDPRFDGYYATVSWFPTGNHRPYDRKAGYARRPVTEANHGAVELTARYGVVDLVDQAIDGGEMQKWFVAANWWASRRWRFALGYGRALLDKDGLRGTTGQTLMRVQWVY